MAEDEPPRKRAKVDSELQKNPKYWFKTGNVVLVANGCEAFKVHSDFLGQRSKVFRDLLSGDLPQPTNQETMDGSPVIPLSDDQDDFKIFLDFVYNSWDFQFDNKRPRWSVVRVMITLGDKYDAPTFRNEGIRRLKMAFSEDLKEWDQDLGIACNWATDAISIACVTRTLEQESPDLHAAALYMCCSMVPLPILLQNIGNGVSDKALHPEDLRRCLLGRDDLGEFWYDSHEELVAVDPPPEHVCYSPAACTKTKTRLRASILSISRRSFDPDISCHPLSSTFVEEVVDTAKKWGMCPKCYRFYRERLFAMRQTFRKGLKDRFKQPDGGND